MKKAYTLQEASAIGLQVKRFTYNAGANTYIVKPKKGEQLFIHHDYLGNRSLFWVVCTNAHGEQWRHNVETIMRITYHPIPAPVVEAQS